MLKCTKCEKSKTEASFYRSSKAPTGRQTICKECFKSFASVKTGTLESFARSRWNGLSKRTVNGSHAQPNHPRYACYFANGIRLAMTKDEFYGFCQKNKAKIMDCFRRKEIPSIDRKDSEGHYSLDNIQILSLTANVAKANKQRKTK